MGRKKLTPLNSMTWVKVSLMFPFLTNRETTTRSLVKWQDDSNVFSSWFASLPTGKIYTMASPGRELELGIRDRTSFLGADRVGAGGKSHSLMSCGGISVISTLPLQLTCGHQTHASASTPPSYRTNWVVLSHSNTQPVLNTNVKATVTNVKTKGGWWYNFTPIVCMRERTE